MFWVFCVCVCVVVHVYMRGTALHILVYFSLLNTNQCRWAPCCIGNWNVRVRLPVAKTKHREFWFVFCFPGDNCFMLLVAIIAEIVFMSLKNLHTHTKKQIEKLYNRTECFLVSLDLLKHNKDSRRNADGDGFWLTWEGSSDALQIPKFLVCFLGWKCKFLKQNSLLIFQVYIFYQQNFHEMLSVSCSVTWTWQLGCIMRLY